LSVFHFFLICSNIYDTLKKKIKKKYILLYTLKKMIQSGLQSRERVKTKKKEKDDFYRSDYDKKYLFGYSPTTEGVIDQLLSDMGAGGANIRYTQTKRKNIAEQRARSLTQLDKMGAKIPPRLVGAGLGTGASKAILKVPPNIITQLPEWISIVPPRINTGNELEDIVGTWTPEQIYNYVNPDQNNVSYYGLYLSQGGMPIEALDDVLSQVNAQSVKKSDYIRRRTEKGISKERAEAEWARGNTTRAQHEEEEKRKDDEEKQKAELEKQKIEQKETSESETKRQNLRDVEQRKNRSIALKLSKIKLSDVRKAFDDMYKGEFGKEFKSAIYRQAKDRIRSGLAQGQTIDEIKDDLDEYLNRIPNEGIRFDAGDDIFSDEFWDNYDFTDDSDSKLDEGDEGDEGDEDDEGDDAAAESKDDLIESKDEMLIDPRKENTTTLDQIKEIISNPSRENAVRLDQIKEILSDPSMTKEQRLNQLKDLINETKEQRLKKIKEVFKKGKKIAEQKIAEQREQKTEEEKKRGGDITDKILEMKNLIKRSKERQGRTESDTKEHKQEWSREEQNLSDKILEMKNIIKRVQGRIKEKKGDTGEEKKGLTDKILEMKNLIKRSKERQGRTESDTKEHKQEWSREDQNLADEILQMKNLIKRVQKRKGRKTEEKKYTEETREERRERNRQEEKGIVEIPVEIPSNDPIPIPPRGTEYPPDWRKGDGKRVATDIPPAYPFPTRTETYTEDPKKTSDKRRRKKPYPLPFPIPFPYDRKRDSDSDDDEQKQPYVIEEHKQRIKEGFLRPLYSTSGQDILKLTDKQELQEIRNWDLFDLPIEANEDMSNPLYRNRLMNMSARYDPVIDKKPNTYQAGNFYKKSDVDTYFDPYVPPKGFNEEELMELKNSSKWSLYKANKDKLVVRSAQRKNIVPDFRDPYDRTPYNQVDPAYRHHNTTVSDIEQRNGTIYPDVARHLGPRPSDGESHSSSNTALILMNSISN
jgi:hypothetical protein